MKFRCFGLYGVLLRETYKNDSQGYFSNVTLYFTGKCSVKYPPGRVEYAETTKFILSFLYIVTVQCFYSVMAKCKSPLLMVIISLKWKSVFLMCRILHGWTGVLFYAWYMVETVPKSFLWVYATHKVTNSQSPQTRIFTGFEGKKRHFVSLWVNFLKSSLYIFHFLLFFLIFFK